MGKFWISLGAAVLFNCATPHIAAVIPFDPARVPDGATQLGQFYSGIGFTGTADLRYDSSTGHLSYGVGGGDFFLPDPSGGIDHFGSFNGFFGWTANINQLGEIQGTGAAADPGSRQRPRASRHRQCCGLWLRLLLCFPTPDDCTFGHPQVSIEMSLSTLASRSSWETSGCEGFMNIDMAEQLLSNSFRCGPTTSSSSNCGRVSGARSRVTAASPSRARSCC